MRLAKRFMQSSRLFAFASIQVRRKGTDAELIIACYLQSPDNQSLEHAILNRSHRAMQILASNGP